MQPISRYPLLGAATILWRLVSSQTIEFFYTETLDTCAINGAFIQANEQTTHGGVCAYRQDVDRVYGCPAPDPTCWTWAQECNENGIGQTICNRGGTVFCCNAVAGETCTTTEGQINVCISNFSSPNSGVDVDTANELYLSALNINNVTATSQVIDPTPFSTSDLLTTSSPDASASSSGTNTPSTTIDSMTGTQTSDSSSSARSSTATESSSASGSSEPLAAVQNQSGSTSALSGGAIAGIVIGAVLVCLIISGIFFVLGRQRRQQGSNVPSWKDGTFTSFYAPNQGKRDEKAPFVESSESQTFRSELDSEGVSRVEMPSNNMVAGNSAARQQHYELP